MGGVGWGGVGCETAPIQYSIKLINMELAQILWGPHHHYSFFKSVVLSSLAIKSLFCNFCFYQFPAFNHKDPSENHLWAWDIPL